VSTVALARFDVTHGIARDGANVAVGEHADDFTIFDHRKMADLVVHHQLGSLEQRIGRPDRDGRLGHRVAHGQALCRRLDPDALGLEQIGRRQLSDQEAVFHDRKHVDRRLREAIDRRTDSLVRVHRRRDRFHRAADRHAPPVHIGLRARAVVEHVALG